MEREPQIFLSYASEDREQVSEFYRRLQAEGFRPWMDKANLLPGQVWDTQVREALRASDCVIVFLSTASVSKRGYVQKEFRLALEVLDEVPEGQIFLIPAKLDDCQVPKMFHSYHWVNLYEEGGFESIIQSIQTLAVKVSSVLASVFQGESISAGKFLAFVHLSDLHFQAETVNTQFDYDKDIRNEVIRDLERLQDELPPLSGVLISGDTAFAGKQVEYEEAGRWLEALCTTISCEPFDVWVVPGNHDVDIGAIDKSKPLRDIRKEFRDQNTPKNHHDYNRILEDCLRDKDLQSILFRPLANYMAFAQQRECRTTHDKLVWDYDFTLNDGSTLRIRGANSALISDLNDDNRQNRLILGSTQTIMHSKPGVAYGFLCHHPPDWLFAHDEIEDDLSNRAALHLFGHKHRYRARKIGERALRVHAGALHPDRGEADWDPRYNIISMHVEGTGNDRKLVVQMWQRQWSRHHQRFTADRKPDSDSKFTIFSLDLDPWVRRPQDDQREQPSQAPISSSTPITLESQSFTEEEEMRDHRRLRYRFFELDWPERRKVLDALDLFIEEDRGLNEGDLVERVFSRVRQNDRISELRELIDKYDKGEIA